MRHQRRFLKISQQELAKRVGVDQSAVSAWEDGTKTPTLERQLAIADALSVAPELLFGFYDVGLPLRRGRGLGRR